jgi:hypothetical protein
MNTSRIRVSIVLVAALLLLAGDTSRSAQFEKASEYEIKAAFLYNFARFIDWPDSVFSDPATPFVVGVFGKDPFGEILDKTFEGKSVEGRHVVVRRVDNVDGALGCHLLFVAHPQTPHLRRFEAQAIVTVGESERFVDQGGAIGFIIEDNRVRFTIGPGAATRAGVTMSSKLLSLSRRGPGN